MRALLCSTALLLGLSALRAAAQDYFEETAQAKNGGGYGPASIVAGWERQFDYTVLAIGKDGTRRGGASLADDWKATLITSPRLSSEDRDDEDEKVIESRGGRAAPARERAPERPAQAVAPRREVTYSSLTCPALVTRIEALKPLTGFEYVTPALNGNEDGPAGNGHDGFDVWIRAGGAELKKTAGTADSALARWFQETTRVLAACPAGAPPQSGRR